MGAASRFCKSRRGSAIMLAMSTLLFIIFMSLEITDMSLAEYFASSGEVKKVQAYYAAKSCMQLNLLRIKAYQQATAALGDKIPDLSFLDLIWRFPLTWPPAIPTDASTFDKSTFNDSVKKSKMKQEFVSSVSAEGGKIDINDLGSVSKTLRDRTRRQLLERLQARVQNNDDSFADRYANYNFNELINNIADWIDADDVSQNGGGEKGLYSDFRNQFLPPNRPLKTIDELHMIAGMTDEIYAILAPEITLFGVKGINVNQAEQDVLMSLFSRYDPQQAKELVTRILQRRNDPNLGGPFKEMDDFLGFIGAYVDPQEFNEERVPLFFGAELNFRISCTGVAGQVIREMEAVVYNGDGVAEKLKDAINLDRDAEGLNDPLEKQCSGLQGDQKYECLCQNEPDDTTRNTCIQNRRKSDQTSGQQKKGGAKQVRPGPPAVIYLQVK